MGEFLQYVVKEHTAPDDLKQMDTRLNHLVQEYNTRSSLPLSYAVGYEVSYRNHYFMINDLIQAADKNMYQDKFYKKTDAIKGELPAFSRPSSVIPTVSSDILAEKIRQFQSNAKNIHPIALVSTDIENFHYINDKYGYPLGNEILNILYEELASSSFSLFTIRFFSDVFITIADMKEATPKELSEQVQALDHKICSRIRDTYQVSFFRTNSGICLMQDEAQTPEAVISCSNIARRIAKKMISHTCIYSDEIDHQEKMQAEILHSFHQALNDQEFIFSQRFSLQQDRSPAQKLWYAGYVAANFYGHLTSISRFLSKMVLSLIWITIFMKRLFPGSRTFLCPFQKVFAFL